MRVWSIRSADIDFSASDWLGRLIFKLEARLSRVADLAISNSEAGARNAVCRGFPAGKTIIIPNGINVERFRPDREAGRRVRQELKISDDALVVGNLGRLDPLKDLPTLLRAAALCKGNVPNAVFVFAGGGPLDSQLKALSADLGLATRVIWAGARRDPEAVLNAFDVYCSSSVSEGLSNSIAEALATGLPCVVTNVGDSAFLVGNCGAVVPPRAPELLAEALTRVLATKLQPAEPRERILQLFSIGSLIDRTEQRLIGLTNAISSAEA